MNREILVFMVTLILLGPLSTTSAGGHTARTTAMANILVNSDFDLGPGLPWVEYSEGDYDIISSSSVLPTSVLPLPSGTFAAWLGGYHYAYDYLYQDVAIPDYATSVELRGFRYVTTEEGGGAWDYVTIAANSSPILTWTNEDSTTWWMSFSTSLDPFIGETIRLGIAATTDSTLVTNFFFDSLELIIEYLEIPDVAVTDVVTSKTGCLPVEVVGESRNLSINVTIANQGTVTETFNLAVFANGTQVDSQPATLSPAEVATLTFTWNTLGFLKGDYMIGAVADLVAGENDTADNVMNYGYTLLTLAGDVDGDRDVDIFDIVRMAGVYGIEKPDPRYDPNCDVDGDGDIDIFDLVAAAGRYGQSW